ncbi:MAG TPA: PRC-barrel domain containing protein [Aggregicoccus sp.]|nr:PRC-barrel domain containing protein [Aggregicoccus sp.]
MSGTTESGERNWWETPFERRSVQVGMTVWTEDGQRLGRVGHMSGALLHVRPRTFSRAAYRVPVADIVGLGAGGVRVRGPRSAYALAREALEPGEVPEHTLPVPDSALH